MVIAENTPFPAKIPLRLLYGASLLIVVTLPLLQVRYGLTLLRQMAQNPNVVNPITALKIFVVAIVLAIVVGRRLLGLLRGTVTLQSYPDSRYANAVRITGIIFMALGALLTAALLGAVGSGHGAAAFPLLATQLQYGTPIGLALFELSRLIGFERSVSIGIRRPCDDGIAPGIG
jgi:hypothetical protein